MLANDVVRRVHGEDGLRQAKQATDALFGGTLSGLTAQDLMPVFADAPSSELPIADVVGTPVIKVAVASGLCKSAGEARRLADGGGLYVNNERAGASDVITEGHVIDGQLIVLRSGRKTYRLVKLAR